MNLRSLHDPEGPLDPDRSGGFKSTMKSEKRGKLQIIKLSCLTKVKSRSKQEALLNCPRMRRPPRFTKYQLKHKFVKISNSYSEIRDIITLEKKPYPTSGNYAQQLCLWVGRVGNFMFLLQALSSK